MQEDQQFGLMRENEVGEEKSKPIKKVAESQLAHKIKLYLNGSDPNPRQRKIQYIVTVQPP